MGQIECVYRVLKVSPNWRKKKHQHNYCKFNSTASHMSVMLFPFHHKLHTFFNSVLRSPLNCLTGLVNVSLKRIRFSNDLWFSMILSTSHSMPLCTSVRSAPPDAIIWQGVPNRLHNSSIRKKYVMSITSIECSKSCLLATMSNGLPRIWRLCINLCKISRIISNGACNEQSITNTIPKA